MMGIKAPCDQRPRLIFTPWKRYNHFSAAQHCRCRQNILRGLPRGGLKGLNIAHEVKF